jgi:hypothetical protein
MPTGWRSEYLVEISQPDFLVHNSLSYLEVISKVVPKIWARTNSAMAGDVGLFYCVCFKMADDDAEVRGSDRVRRGSRVEGEIEKCVRVLSRWSALNDGDMCCQQTSVVGEVKRTAKGWDNKSSRFRRVLD